MQYQTNRMSLSRNICQKPDFGPNLGLKWPKFGPEIFFQPQNHKYLLDIMLVYHNMQNQQNILKKMAENPRFGSGSFKNGIWRQK